MSHSGIMHRPVNRLGAVVGLLGLVVASCAGDQRETSLDAARGSLTRYVNAITAGNFEEAMNERCTAARIKDEDKTLFLNQAARMVEALGPLGIVSVRMVDVPSGLRPVTDLPSPVEMSYRLSMKGSPAGADLITVIVKEDGKQRLCGFATEEAKRLHASLSRPVGDLGSTTQDPRGLMPPPPAGYQQVADTAGTPTKPGLKSTWSRAWQFGDYGGARVTTAKYETTAQATSGATELLQGVASDGVGEFDLQGLPEARGVRYLGYAWLWVQPVTEGPFIDQVVMKFGDNVVSVTVSNLHTGSGHEVAAKLTDDVARLARS